MKQKVAIVTGGGSGIGYATAKKLVEQDIITYIIGRNEQKLNEAQRKLGAGCQVIAYDLTDINGLKKLVNTIHKEAGRIDMLINNAGINLKKSLEEVTDLEFQKVIQTNLNAVFSLTREVAKIMIDQKHGVVLNISSMAAQYGIPYVIAYTASKTAIEGMTRAMAVELSPHGIRVNCIAPGFIKTNMSSNALKSDPERLGKVLSRTPMGKLGEPNDVADAACFLLSDASKYITGVVLPVDGGNSIGF